jgi:hypothetical protein
VKNAFTSAVGIRESIRDINARARLANGPEIATVNSSFGFFGRASIIATPPKMKSMIPFIFTS